MAPRTEEISLTFKVSSLRVIARVPSAFKPACSLQAQTHICRGEGQANMSIIWSPPWYMGLLLPVLDHWEFLPLAYHAEHPRKLQLESLAF